MYRSFNQIIQNAERLHTRKVAVVMADGEALIQACREAYDKQMIIPVFIGKPEDIQGCGGDFEGAEIVEAQDEKTAADIGVELVRSGKAHMIMKGKLQTSTFLKAIVNSETGLTGGNVLSHILVFEKDDRLRIITDGGIIMYPDLDQKIRIIRNAVKVMHSLGEKDPKVAPICAVETVNPGMQATMDAALLSKMNDRGQITGCRIDGPLALDNAVSEKAAQQKGIISDVAGDADILLVPDIEAGNILGKSIIYFAQCQSGGIIAGAQAPVIMLSRADNSETKLNSIALAMACAEGGY